MGNQAATEGCLRTMLQEGADAIFAETRPLCALGPAALAKVSASLMRSYARHMG